MEPSPPKLPALQQAPSAVVAIPTGGAAEDPRWQNWPIVGANGRSKAPVGKAQQLQPAYPTPRAAAGGGATSSYCTLPFDPAAVAGLIDPNDCSMLEVPDSDARLYKVLLAHIAKTADGSSFRVVSRRADDSDDSDDDDDDGARDDDDGPEVGSPHDAAAGGGGGAGAAKSQLVAGLGVFRLADATGGASSGLVAIHQTSGEAVSNACGGATKLHSVVLLAPGRRRARELRALADRLAAEASPARTFAVRTWHAKHQYWNRRAGRVEARPLASVVLPDAVKRGVVEDIREFLSPAAAAWYREHGIPYKRAYLFHGVPGAGKTSLIQALAGELERDVCFLQPNHPDMTDDSLKAAIEEAPARALVVLEDVDALFEGRVKRFGSAHITFSGLLNALDGVGSARGRLFVLTTNHREKLDPALIRCGRVDQHVHFDFVVDEQLAGLFRQFYPACADGQPEAFVEAVRGVLGGRQVAAAAVQALFIRCRTASAEEAIARASYIVEELESRDAKEDEKWRKKRHTPGVAQEE